jgi:hypothetical protein
VIQWVFDAFQFGGLASFSLIGLWMLRRGWRRPTRPKPIDVRRVHQSSCALVRSNDEPALPAPAGTSVRLGQYGLTAAAGPRAPHRVESAATFERFASHAR